jgi:hypothetical protein
MGFSGAHESVHAELGASAARNHPITNLEAFVRDAGINVSAETLLSEWQGERMDMGMAVEGLLQPNDL